MAAGGVELRSSFLPLPPPTPLIPNELYAVIMKEGNGSTLGRPYGFYTSLFLATAAAMIAADDWTLANVDTILIVKTNVNARAQWMSNGIWERLPHISTRRTDPTPIQPLPLAPVLHQDFIHDNAGFSLTPAVLPPGDNGV